VKYSEDALKALHLLGGATLLANSRLHPPYPAPGRGNLSRFKLSRTTTEKLLKNGPLKRIAALLPHPLNTGLYDTLVGTSFGQTAFLVVNPQPHLSGGLELDCEIAMDDMLQANSIIKSFLYFNMVKSEKIIFKKDV
jgi:hypothetical protein